MAIISGMTMRSANMSLVPFTRIRFEGFWSIIKRGVVDTFHKVSKKHMPLYVA